jgi:hypothetical protein
MSWDVRLRDVFFLSLISALALGWYFNCCFEARVRDSIVREHSTDAARIEALKQTIDNLVAESGVEPQPSLAEIQMLQALRGDLQQSL